MISPNELHCVAAPVEDERRLQRERPGRVAEAGAELRVERLVARALRAAELEAARFARCGGVARDERVVHDAGPTSAAKSKVPMLNEVAAKVAIARSLTGLREPRMA